MLAVAAVLLPRVLVLCWKPGVEFPDERWYLEIAGNLLETGRYTMDQEGLETYAVCKAPGLPFVLAAAGAVFPLNPWTAKGVNHLAGLLACALLARTVCRATGSGKAGWLTFLGAGLHPGLIYLENTLFPQTFQALILALSLPGWLLLFKERGRPFRDGLLAGLGALFVPMHVVVLPVLWGTRILLRRAGWRYAMLSTVGVLTALAPWMLRNAVTERAFIPLTVTAGQQFYSGFNAQAGMNTGVCIDAPEALLRELRDTRSGREFERVHWKHALRWVRNHPARAVQLWGLKFINWFRWDAGQLRTRKAAGDLFSAWIQRMTSLTVLAVFLAGWLRLPARSPLKLFLVLLPLGLAAAHAFFVTRYRYRLPFEPFFLACGVIGWFRNRGEGCCGGRGSGPQDSGTA